MECRHPFSHHNIHAADESKQESQEDGMCNDICGAKRKSGRQERGRTTRFTEDEDQALDEGDVEEREARVPSPERDDGEVDEEWDCSATWRLRQHARSGLRVETHAILLAFWSKEAKSRLEPIRVEPMSAG